MLLSGTSVMVGDFSTPFRPGLRSALVRRSFSPPGEARWATMLCESSLNSRTSFKSVPSTSESLPVRCLRTFVRELSRRPGLSARLESPPVFSGDTCSTLAFLMAASAATLSSSRGCYPEDLILFSGTRISSGSRAPGSTKRFCSFIFGIQKLTGVAMSAPSFALDSPETLACTELLDSSLYSDTREHD